MKKSAYQELINGFDQFFKKRQTGYDALYFVWTCVADCLIMGNQGKDIEIFPVFEACMSHVENGNAYAHSLFSPVENRENSYQTFKEYTRFSEHLNDLGIIWKELLKDQNTESLMELIHLLKRLRSFLDDMHNALINSLKENNASFRLFTQYVKDNEIQYKQYHKTLSHTIHNLYICVEYIDLKTK
ncbi:hypothetical protein IV49_GL000086 [Kandleria vitulina DSM 20405]|jgi:hypothetical protein|uniref:Uncharacterized protein n=1 Tax=Kandleria vitulina DSM 20405 TaxID=1410657 RepID=A0A0R2HPV3_9FIRM|nr:hypothetical protein [Kandleria vitulina]KRN51469.1 hypothetical protein IV49_GL000086 [Kandleria vitulina DSM 20405]SDL26491.1 hypothetical protein SAMN05216520_10340 [Kandleria vitulina]SEJ09045.1 hypothetical protein SAMN05216514_11034 [Kandleria vitulina]